MNNLVHDKCRFPCFGILKFRGRADMKKSREYGTSGRELKIIFEALHMQNSVKVS